MHSACLLALTKYRVSIKSFPDYKHFLQENYVEYKHIYFFQNITQLSKFFFTTQHGERLIDNQFLSTCSPTCPVIAAKASVILAFKFVISGTGVENTLSLTYPHKKKSRGEVIFGDRGGQVVGLSLPIHLFGNVALAGYATVT